MRRVTKLPGNGHWVEGPRGIRTTSQLQHSNGYAHDQPALYLLELVPGTDYTLGLRCAITSSDRPSVTLFDRWPQDPGAKSYMLPTGPVVRTNYEKIEYRWRIGVSSRSQGNFAVLRVEMQPGISRSERSFRHALYLTSPAISPLNQIGEGITYLRGPQDLVLPPTNEGEEYVVEYPFIENYPPENLRPPASDEHDLIRNGDFSQGLAGWQLWPKGGGGVGVFDGKLRIWSQDSSTASGIVQQMDVEIQPSDALQLSLDVLIAAQTETSGPTGPSPLSLDICYENTQGEMCCGDSAFRLNFAINFGNFHGQKLGVVYLPQNEWTHYTLDLGRLDLKLRRIIRVELSGNGAPMRESWVQNLRIAR